MIFLKMSDFLSVCKTLEGKETDVDEVRGHTEAERVIRKSLDAYLDHFCRS
jgi:hypothetical protein